MKMKRTRKAGHTIQEVLLGVVKHVRILETGELALQPAQIAFPGACCSVFGLLTDNLLLLDCDILDALQRPADVKCEIRKFWAAEEHFRLQCASQCQANSYKRCQRPTKPNTPSEPLGPTHNVRMIHQLRLAMFQGHGFPLTAQVLLRTPALFLCISCHAAWVKRTLRRRRRLCAYNSSYAQCCQARKALA